jgi:3-phosphoglycerate kinase
LQTSAIKHVHVWHAQGLDIGPATIQAFMEALSNSRTVLWNGPMGVFEFEKFSDGTTAIANAVAALTPKASGRDRSLLSEVLCLEASLAYCAVN